MLKNQNTKQRNAKISVHFYQKTPQNFEIKEIELDFYVTFFFFIFNFQKEETNNMTHLIILIVKSLQIELQIYYYDPQSGRINVQAPQSNTTPSRLTLRNNQ